MFFDVLCFYEFFLVLPPSLTSSTYGKIGGEWTVPCAKMRKSFVRFRNFGFDWKSLERQRPDQLERCPFISLNGQQPVSVAVIIIVHGYVGGPDHPRTLSFHRWWYNGRVYGQSTYPL
ncbi:hypothetical protein THAOC_30459 [Thalassiosira oceanica]|uniref:Secreted protein n=1 Tax=Thalassiosira oceanica TaxID=159749 RepID=K0RE68_THAOC|nr:hypothetical protein THAOC_30459 [Thalassiosira oceanica]|eukprot:EJK50539.1 hypothetical protein THAOC_30459 [Thalassiosira oceanica]